MVCLDSHWHCFYSVADPDLQIRGRGGGGGGRHPNPEIRRGAVSKKNYFGPQFGLKM